MKKINAILSLLLTILFFFSSDVFAQTTQKLRVLVLSDIEADPDDTQSMIRFLLYSNQWDVEGLIATTSIHQQTRVAPESILKVLDAYKKVQPNLLKHEKGYPSYDELKPIVKKGLAVYGMKGVGEGKDSEGSDWIVKVLEKNDDRPVMGFCVGRTKYIGTGIMENKKNKECNRSRKACIKK